MKNGFIKTAIFTFASAILYKLSKKSMQLRKANKDIYMPSKEFFVDSNINGKKMVFLGSSITHGLASKGKSFVDFLNIEHGVNTIKEAVSGTTLAGEETSSYVSRMKNNLNTNENIDLFACQLSTNDQRKKKPIGKISDSYNLEDFDINTTIGAIEYIIEYVQNNWDCPTVFYTCLRKPDPGYELLREKLFELQKKWHFAIIDVWNNNEIKKMNHNNPYFMADDVHPTCAGYRYGWTPIFVKNLDQMFAL
ncbi:SGNH/GDSL hydrolase family protein [Apilactobacillus timberlakei]|uniref:SGNH/GDSL hydrolase family protein n=1 Tax=Apilactobacillus timberlakei TaxID=2008380 RepID=UPI00112A4A68|nr:SGNH/GDSL hydrolase family protein [Apilactobacillus timberlakei]TPR19172.1 SGNH/GDSL hydrolase family protein [Apilactobacillus timberlakei]TPR19529.1 SGNH/GDSL hydrolase family protein [Apilactobacillus timberlakei]TPR20506.1 SGNH/GDSL hydrolase family protein [Apilactobacillus timberlakei]TPR22550.1 SGNH/GDSL hydrolase family protein [Apilactobacillus timberlakei]